MPQWCRQPYGNRVQANRLHCVSTQTYCHFLPYVCTAPAFPRLGKCTGPIATQLQSIRDQAEQPHPGPAPVSPATAIRDPERRERRGFSLSPLPSCLSPPPCLPSDKRAAARRVLTAHVCLASDSWPEVAALGGRQQVVELEWVGKQLSSLDSLVLAG